MSAPLALLRAVHAALDADPEVASLLGGRIHDRVPDRSAFPYATYGAMRSRDLDGEALSEHALSVEIWSRRHGRGEALRALEALRAALSDAPLSLDAHRLVSLRVLGIAVPEGATEIERGVLELRAVTEPDPS